MVKINPMRVPGKWRQGYVLDYHTLRSEFLGYDEFGHPMFDTQRSEIGELLYRLKYRSDQSVVDTIIETAVKFIALWNPTLNFILPTPPSKLGRPYQPVLEIAKRLGLRLNIALCKDCLVKVKDTPELKNVYDYDERLRLLEDAYSVDSSILKGQNVLLFDDLYRSGATLNAITDALYMKGEAANVYVLALTRTRSAS
jgi:predicted amidophosphoribosyltransferase